MRQQEVAGFVSQVYIFLYGVCMLYQCSLWVLWLPATVKKKIITIWSLEYSKFTLGTSMHVFWLSLQVVVPIRMALVGKYDKPCSQGVGKYFNQTGLKKCPHLLASIVPLPNGAVVVLGNNSLLWTAVVQMPLHVYFAGSGTALRWDGGFCHCHSDIVTSTESW